MRAHVVRLVAALQVFLLVGLLLAPALVSAEEPTNTDPPTPTEQPSDPPASDPPPLDPTQEPTEPEPTTPAAPDPTAPPAPDPTPAPTEPPASPYVPSGPPSIASDKADYAPGELVTLTGANWLAGESVEIYVNDDRGSTWSRRVTVTSDTGGQIIDSFNLPDWFVAQYVVIATGTESGIAMTSFTDGNVKARSNGGLITFDMTFEEHASTQNCGGPVSVSGANNNTGFSGGAQFSRGVANADSIELIAPATSDQGGAFLGWVGETASDIFNPVGYTPPNSRTICVPGNFTGSRTYVAIYVGTGSIEWEKRDDLNALQGGATFTVNPDPTTGTTPALTVVDNGPNDLDPDSGQFRVRAAHDVTYTILETVAPAGWAVDADADRTQGLTTGAPNGVIGTQGTNDTSPANEADFHNRLGTLSWEKRTAVTPFPLLGGATFTVSPNPFACYSGTDPGAIPDDIVAPTLATDDDKDPLPGRFSLSRVCLGSYTITETASPVGFSIDPDPTRAQTVSAANLDAVVGTQGSNQAGVTDESDFHNPANAAPTVAADNASVTVTEGSLASNTGSYSDANAGQDVAISASVGVVTKTGTNTGTWDWFFLTNDGPAQSQTVTITADDGAGGIATTTFSLTVTNVAPTATLGNGGPVNEGTSASVSFTGQYDPSTVDTAAGFHYAFSCTNGDLSGATYAGSGTSASTSCSSSDNGSFPVKARIIDKDGGFTEYTTNLVVNNVAPTGTLGNNGPINEGGSATVSFSGQSDPSSVDTAAGFHYAFSCTNGDLSGATYAGSGTSASTSCSSSDNGSFPVKARIIDKDGGFTEYTTNLVVNNVAPTGTLGNNGPINEGGSATVSFSGQSDPSSVDTAAGFHYAFSCTNGDLSGATYAGSGTSASTSCSSSDNGSFPVKARIIDKDGGFTEYTTNLVVNNVAPTATLNATTTVDEGMSSAVSLTGPFDPSSVDTAAGFHYAFTCFGGDLSAATYAGSGAASSINCTYDDGFAQHTVKARIIDKDGGFTEYSVLVTVNNVSPIATLTNNGPINEGSSASATFSGQSDPSTADTAAGFHYAYSCTNGDLSGSTYAGSGTSTSTTCSFGDNGSFPVKGRILDKDNGFSEYTTSVTVNNVEPTTTVSGAASVNEGSPYSLTLGAIVDPGTDTVSNIRINWGDGSFTNGAVVGANSHTYADGPNTWNITVDITDEDGTFLDQANALSVTVNNVEPTLTISGAASVNEGSSYSLTLGAIADPGTDTVTDIRVNWGDGNSDVYPASGVVTHTYADGPNTWNITVDLRDEDSAPAYFLDQANALAVTVNNVAPTTSNLAGDTTVSEGTATHTYTYDLSDPGADTITAHPSCGIGGVLGANSNTSTGGISMAFSNQLAKAGFHARSRGGTRRRDRRQARTGLDRPEQRDHRSRLGPRYR